MSARKLEAYEFEQAPESKQTPLYQDYTPEAPVGPNLKEILFFVNIACFCIFMALFSFIFLALKLNTALSFIAAMATSFALLQLQRKMMKRKLSKIKVGTTTNLFFRYQKRQLSNCLFYLFLRFEGD